uniref:Uncharacterized protein n=1 Tax=Picea glauca TaxID=3330 RepID=A0A117NJ65_PICGL|nr:hypothetical protein ABT39_MTgene824 [Picea glauca]QHR87157.1 hypothetical protein Q903MT_gene1166 [Picea sitchensis]
MEEIDHFTRVNLLFRKGVDHIPPYVDLPGGILVQSYLSQGESSSLLLVPSSDSNAIYVSTVIVWGRCPSSLRSP